MSRPQAYTARWVWLGAGVLREGWSVTLRDGRILETGPRPAAGARVTDLGEGLLLPGLVNAHTHLELSNLGGLAEPQGDFVDWLHELVRLRPGQDAEAAAAATRRAVAELAGCGTALVGDITNTGRARPALAEAGLSAVSLVEALGPARAEPPPPERIWRGAVLDAQAVAAHAPYSVPAARIRRLKALAGEHVFCMHLAESAAEMEFLAGDGPRGARLEEFLRARNLRREELGLTAAHPLDYLADLGALDRHTLLVHGVQLAPADAPRLAQRGVSLCVCPRSNLGLNGALAPVEAMLAAGVNLCLGTDSLVSSPDLVLWRELAVLLTHLPGLDPEAALAMATSGGAAALGLADHFGRLAPGFCGPLCFAPLRALGPAEVIVAAIAEAAPRAVGGLSE